jgi:hypothetical protein
MHRRFHATVLPLAEIRDKSMLEQRSRYEEESPAPSLAIYLIE